MRLSWSFLRLLLAATCVVGLGCLFEQATGEQAEDVARSLGVADVHDWDIRSLYRVRFQHITKRPPPGLRHAERKSNLANRWAALKERLAEFFPSRHTNPRTVVTFDKIATDFVNVGIVKLAKALDPPKPLPKRGSRKPNKGAASTANPSIEESDSVDVAGSRGPTEPTPADVRPKRRVTLLVDLPEFDLQDFDVPRKGLHRAEGSTRPSVLARGPEAAHPALPEALMQLATDRPCAGSGAVAQGPPWTILITASSVAVLLSVWHAAADVLRLRM